MYLVANNDAIWLNIFFSLYLTNNSTCCRNWQNSNLHDPNQTGLCINIRISLTYIKKKTIFSNALFSLLDNTFNPNSHCKKMYTSFFMFIIFFFRYFRCWICVHYSLNDRNLLAKPRTWNPRNSTINSSIKCSSDIHIYISGIMTLSLVFYVGMKEASNTEKYISQIHIRNFFYNNRLNYWIRIFLLF